MTREQIARELDFVDFAMQNRFDDYGESTHRALQEAIKLIKQEPCEDCIDRAEAMTEIQMNARKYTIAKEFNGMGEVEWSDYLISIKDALDILIKLPPATPTRKKGEEE